MQGMDYVYEVYREKSFSTAARKLFVSQPALSSAVKKVEQSLGIEIFDRSTSPIQLTTAGRAYIDAAEQIFTINRKLKNYCNDLANLQSGTLSLGGTNFFASCLLPPIIKKFSELYPQIQLRITESDSNDLYKRLLSEDLDLIVDSGIYDEKAYDSIPLLEDHILLAVPTDNPIHRNYPSYRFSQVDIIERADDLQDIPALPLARFAEEQFLLLGKGNDMHRRAINLCQNSGFIPHVRLYLNQLMTAYHMACQGLGLTFVTDSLVRHAMPSTALTYYKIEDLDATRKIFIAKRKNSHPVKAMQEFIRIGKSLHF
jgi:DNA-binding transcriptional LysR family regulator